MYLLIEVLTYSSTFRLLLHSVEPQGVLMLKTLQVSTNLKYTW